MPVNNQRPLPDPARSDAKPYWDACQRDELVVQRCVDCRQWIWYPQDVCHSCSSWNIEWVKVDGKGTVYSWVILRHPLHPYFVDKLPLLIALVELNEAPGVRITTNIVDCDLEAMVIGMPVEAVYEKVDATVTLPMFRPVN